MRRDKLVTNMKRILVPIDFSEVTPPVIDLAREFAKALHAEIYLVHVKELSAAAAAGTLSYGLAALTASPTDLGPVARLRLALPALDKRKAEAMKLLNMPRQPFVGLAIMAAMGIILAEVF